MENKYRFGSWWYASFDHTEASKDIEFLIAKNRADERAKEEALLPSTLELQRQNTAKAIFDELDKIYIRYLDSWGAFRPLDYETFIKHYKKLKKKYLGEK